MLKLLINNVIKLH